MGGLKEPSSICLAALVVPYRPSRGKRVVMGGVSLVWRYFLSLAFIIACSTEHLSVCLIVWVFEISVTSVMGPVMFS